MDTNRRSFLKGVTIAGAGLSLDAGAVADNTSLPSRILGKTGDRVSILAMGGGSRYLMYKNDDEAIEAATKALDSGITYIDSADDYGRDHLSEKRIGQALKGRRNGVFLATKLTNRDGAQSRKIVEASLRALQVDHTDLIHIHSLTDKNDLESIFAKGGVLEQLMKMRDEKMTRFVGITSHYDPVILKAALERHDFDCTQMALNGALTGMTNGEGGMVPNPAIVTSFETVALPVAKRKNMGIIAMKVFAQEALLAHSTPEKLLHYSLSLPVSTAVVGMPKLQHITENVQFAKNFQPLSKTEMQQLSHGLAGTAKAQLDQFFANHIDA